jgi:hypothetical protein
VTTARAQTPDKLIGRNIYTIKGEPLSVALPFKKQAGAIAVPRQIKFIPATKNVKNVSMWLQLEYNFNLYR